MSFGRFALGRGFGRLGGGLGSPSGGGGGLPSASVIYFVEGDSTGAGQYFDPNTTTTPTIGTYRNRSGANFVNWAVARYAQPWENGGNFAQSGETSVDVTARLSNLTTAITACVAANPTARVYVWICLPTNDIPNLGLDSVAVIWARVQNIATSIQAVGARPIIVKVAGSELWNSTNVTRTVAYNALAAAWVASHTGDALKPLLHDQAAVAHWNTPDATQTTNGVCTSQTPSSGVPLTLASSTFSGGRKILFSHTEGTTRSLAIVGTLNGVAVSETLSLVSGVALKATRFIYDVITSITPAASFTNSIVAGWTGITHIVDYKSDSLHNGLLGAYVEAAAAKSVIAADCTPIPLARRGSNARLNPLFSTATGGLVTGSFQTVNGVAASSSNVPSSVRVVTSSANITAVDWNFGIGAGTAEFTATTNSSAALVTNNIRHDPSVALFTGGDRWEIWTDFTIYAGATNLVALSASLSINYTPLAVTNSSLSWSGGIATVTLTAPHGLTTGESMPFVTAAITASEFTASITGTVMTVTGSVTGQALAVNQVITGAGVTAGTKINSLGTGTGGAGTYNVSASQTIVSEAMAVVSGYVQAAGTKAVITGASTYTFALATDPGTYVSPGTGTLGGTMLYYDERGSATTTGLGKVPSATDQTYSVRFADIPILHGLTISSINLISGPYMSDAGTTHGMMSGWHLAKQP